MLKFLFGVGKESDLKDSESKSSVFRVTMLFPTAASRYDAPNIDEHYVENVPMVPTDFAETKINELSDDLLKTKEQYDNHVSNLKSFNETSLQTLKVFYETQLKDLKSKAIRHANVQTQIKKINDDKSNTLISERV
jgi:hypothetical protein